MMAQLSSEKIFKNRIVFLTVFFLLVLLAIILRLAYLQIVQNSYYKTLADNQRTGQYQLLPTRGQIQIWDNFNKQPYIVATSSKKILVYANPKYVVNIDDTAKQLGEILKLDISTITSKLQQTDKQYVVIKKDLSEAEQELITTAKIAGVYFDAETSRLYPEGTMLAHLLGFVGFQGDKRTGAYGLELAFESRLAGVAGVLSQEKDNAGRWIFGTKRDRTPAKDGDTLILSIDKTIQLKTETILQETVKKHQADSGSVVIMDPKTGRILAMSTYPSYNLNSYSKVDNAEVYINQVTLGAYEPGSIFKPLTLAAAINEGKLTPETTFIDTGEVGVDGYKIKNSDSKSYGLQTMAQVLEQSLNTGTIFAKDSIGNEKFLEYVKKFGFGKKIGFEVAENSGDLANLKGNIKVNYHTASFGQGISVTPLQMVQAFSAFANEGKMVKPYVVSGIVYADGKVEDMVKIETTGVITSKTASVLTGMMVNVVENGHGKKAGVPGYYIAGKTGTAQVSRKDGRGYEENNNIGSFIGFGPVENPRFVMLVRVNHPRTVKFAESTAAPAFGEIAQFLLQYFEIPPTRK